MVSTNQRAVIDSSLDRVSVNAMAGSGKTFLLREYVKRNPQEDILFLVYNRSNRVSAKQWRYDNLNVHTTHSLSYDRRYSSRVGDITVEDISEEFSVNPKEAELILKVYKNFLSSSDSVVKEKHVTLQRECREPTRGVILNNVVACTQRLWNEVIDVDSKLPVDFDAFLKLWTLSNPDMSHYDTILLDEAQDSNQALTDVLIKQDCKLIAVGDRNQSLYGYRTTNGFNFFDRMKPTYYMNQTFRFGQEIAYIANEVLKEKGEEELLVGNPNVKSMIGDVSSSGRFVVLCRSKSSLVPESLKIKGKKIFFVDRDYYDTLCSVWRLKYSKVHPDTEALKHYESYKDLLDAVDDEDDLRTYVDVVEKYGERLRPLFGSRSRVIVFSASDANVILTTTHKVKGETFRNVRLANDFVELGKKKRLTKNRIEELNILYVAITRAREMLELNNNLKTYLRAGLRFG